MDYFFLPPFFCSFPFFMAIITQASLPLHITWIVFGAIYSPVGACLRSLIPERRVTDLKAMNHEVARELKNENLNLNNS
jgi:hypothetical protein